MDADASRTALSAAVARGRHRLEHPPPWVLDDAFALVLVGPEWTQHAQVWTERYGDEVSRQAVAGIALRSRYAEDRLAAGAQRQYVLLGAGLDSFAWRRPDLGGALRVFEVDHPASQRFKHERAEALGLPATPWVVPVPIDFERETLREGLDRAGFAWDEPACFTWLGVTMYLSLEAVEATLHTVAECAPGSEVVFSYGKPVDELDDVGRRFAAVSLRLLDAVGEPVRTVLSRRDAEALVERCGLRVADHPDRDELAARYFAGREDGLRPYTVEGLIAAGR